MSFRFSPFPPEYHACHILIDLQDTEDDALDWRDFLSDDLDTHLPVGSSRALLIHAVDCDGSLEHTSRIGSLVAGCCHDH
jgi:hypothetical protein